jgi:GxxExxY protein
MQEENRISREVVDAALKLHRHFGPGIYESVYEAVLVYELKKRDLKTRQQTPVPLIYEGITFEIGFKTDVVVNDLVILELKSVEKLEPVHFKQLLTYLRLTGLRLGLLINFGENLLKDGIHRVVNDSSQSLTTTGSTRYQTDPFHQHGSSLFLVRTFAPLRPWPT